MLKKTIKQYLPKHEDIKSNRYLKLFGPLLHSPNLFHLNRRSVTGAFTVGLFAAYVPIPFQMVLAAALAILFSVNVPLSIALVWVTNPITMPLMFYAAYLMGAYILSTPEREFTFELSWDWLATEMTAIWEPFILGCLVNGIILAIIGNLFIRWLWRYAVIKNWESRRLKQLRSKTSGA